MGQGGFTARVCSPRVTSTPASPTNYTAVAEKAYEPNYHDKSLQARLKYNPLVTTCRRSITVHGVLFTSSFGVFPFFLLFAASSTKYRRSHPMIIPGLDRFVGHLPA